MSWRDRPYAGDDSQRPEMRLQFRKPSTAVTWLIVANVVVFFLDVLSQNFAGRGAHLGSKCIPVWDAPGQP